MEYNLIKYPKTFHTPFSKGLQNDDRRMEDESCLDGKTLAVTIKMDGENTTMYNNAIHARSLDSAHHPSRSVVKAIHSGIKHLIPDGWRICGENMYAKHSIHYTDLESFFYVFSIWDDDNICLPLNKTRQICEDLGLTHVEVYGTVPNFNKNVLYGDKIRKVDDWKFLEEAYDHVVGMGHEGIVVRNVGQYHYDNFQQNLAKAVRKDHIQTGAVHWATAPVIPNKLKGSR